MVQFYRFHYLLNLRMNPSLKSIQDLDSQNVLWFVYRSVHFKFSTAANSDANFKTFNTAVFYFVSVVSK